MLEVIMTNFYVVASLRLLGHLEVDGGIVDNESLAPSLS